VTERLLVTGATGTVGRHVMKLLSQQNATVRGGVRDRAKATRQFGSTVELATFDFEDEPTFAPALNGVGKVFLLPPLLPNQLELMNRFVDAANAPEFVTL
jgi:uncharacterized protein YbjT (DUF2867 family)